MRSTTMTTAAVMLAASHDRHLHLPLIIVGIVVVCLIGFILYTRSRHK
jgi:hypothetical protein